MNKQEVVKSIASKVGESQKDAARNLSATLEVITEALSKGQKISFVGFGSFEPKKRAARSGRNPRTKEEIQIPATTVARFRAGKSLKDAVK